MANLKTSVTVDIDATPEAVFALLSHPSRMVDWMKSIESAEWAEGSLLESGGKFHMKYSYARKTHDITMELTEVNPPSKLAYHTIEGPYPIEATFDLTSSGKGTSLTYTQNAISDSKLSALGFILTGWFAKSMVRRMLRKDLEKLAELVQQSDGSEN